MTAGAVWAQQPVTARTPATPLVLHDPYFSVWSFDDALTAGPTRHWTGAKQPMTGLLRVDGEVYRFMGDERKAEALPQVSRTLWPTRTIYDFEGAGIHLTQTFFTPALPAELDVLSRPVTYVDWTVRSADGKAHAVSLLFEVSGRLASNTDQESEVWGRSQLGDMQVLRIGTNTQEILGKSGDDLRIDWGWANLALPQQPGLSAAIAGQHAMEHAFSAGLAVTEDELAMPAPPRNGAAVLAARFDLGEVSAGAVTRRALLAYDDQLAIEYLHRRLAAYWRRSGESFAAMLEQAEQEETTLRTKAEGFDRKLVADLEQEGGREYAQIAVVAYRQTLAAHKLVADVDGTPMLFSKENFSNGCIDTVDVTYPSAPFFLLLNPRLLEAQLRPVLEYASLPRWPWPFAPHDLGTYPLANGQVYGGGERTEENQMPVEESGNMLILVNALAHAEGNTDLARQYWPLLAKWADYLLTKGLDPENQLSTDDFAGHMAHNANLSIKAIEALASYAQLADSLGRREEAAKYRKASEQMAGRWMQMAADGDHTKLAFDRAGTWSQKYNLVWNKVLQLKLFPASLPENEVRFYLAHQNAFGLPLDNRKTYTKLDWTTWSATLADNRQDFEKLVAPLYKYMTESPTRVPLSDWHETTDGRQVGFQARSTVGGVYIKMLADPAMWSRWVKQAQP